MTGAAARERRISLALTLHNHQPIGNFGWVFAEVFDQAYAPMVAALERHPRIRLSLHYSGPLLEWLVAERPEFIARLRGLAKRGQVEILGGGLYEPVLASLPERDRVAQVTRMADTIEATFGRRPRGAWLAERVWEPDVPTSLVAAGYDWTILDDAHLRAAAVPEDAMWGPYTTEDKGSLLTVFGTEQGLRYRIPFQEVDDVIRYLREHATEAGERLGTMGDDGEKFGAWPTTYEHCWGERRWVERFFEALEANAAWLTTVLPSDWLVQHGPVGRVYVPTGSYAEMGEWALPPSESRAFASALHAAREAGSPQVRWLRGASWRNFQVKYREVNDLHKQMLRTSAKVAAMEPGAARDAALDHLHRGQSNDCYWHGLFGGIYIAHMRAATLAHLIAAEDAADAALGSAAGSEIRDVDLDGRDELILATDGQHVVIDLDEGAGIGAWDLRASQHALTGVLRRRPEAYHETIRTHEADAVAQARTARPADSVPGDTPASIHDIVHVKEPGLASRLIYDDYERRSGVVRFLPLDMTPDSWAAGGRGELGDVVSGAFTLAHLDVDRAVLSRDGAVMIDGRSVPVRVTNEIAVGGARLDPTLSITTTIENRGTTAVHARMGIEFAVTMLGGGNPQAWWDVDGTRSRHDGAGSAAGITDVSQGNDWLELSLGTSISPAAELWWAPIETVSNSEAGFERVYQGSAYLFSWPAALAPGASLSATVTHRARAARDRATT